MDKDLAYRIIELKDTDVLIDTFFKGAGIDLWAKFEYGRATVWVNAPKGYNEIMKLSEGKHLTFMTAVPSADGYEISWNDDEIRDRLYMVKDEYLDMFVETYHILGNVFSEGGGELVKKVSFSNNHYNQYEFSFEFSDGAKEASLEVKEEKRRKALDELRESEYGKNILDMNNVVSCALREAGLKVSVYGGRSGGNWFSNREKYIYLYVLGEDDYISGGKFSKATEILENKFGEYVSVEFSVFSAPNGISFYAKPNDLALGLFAS